MSFEGCARDTACAGGWPPARVGPSTMVMLRWLEKHGLWLLPLVVVFFLYAQVRGHVYTDFDDAFYTYDNIHVVSGLSWENFKWAWTAFFAANYHPLTWLSHQLDFQLFGAEPGVQALVNAGFHAANSVLVAYVLLQLFGVRAYGILGGALFAMHPVLVEAVAWVSQRKTQLSTFFALLTVLSYFRFEDSSANARARRRWFFVSIFLYLCSLFAKGMFVTMPVMLILLSLIRAEQRRLRGGSSGSESRLRDWVRRFLPIAPYAVLCVAFSVVTFVAQDKGGAVVPVDHMSLSTRIATALNGYTNHLLHFFYPLNLSVLYPPLEGWTVLDAVFDAVALLAITLGCIALRRRMGFSLLWGWLLFLAMLLPVIGLVQVGKQALADRYMYPPIVGLLIMGLVIVARVRDGRVPVPRVLQSGSRWALGAWMAMTSVVAYQQISFWENTHILAAESEKRVGEQADLTSMMARALYIAGRLEDALPLARRAYQLSPAHATVVQNLAAMEMQAKNWAEAERLALQYVRMEPFDPAAYLTLAAVYEGSRKWEALQRTLDDLERLEAKRPVLSASLRANVAGLRRQLESELKRRGSDPE